MAGVKNYHIMIGDVEYVESPDGIHIGVFDNNYMEVYDSVTLRADSKGGLTLERD